MELIIGRDSIKKYQLFEKIPSQLKDVTVVDGTKQCECQPKGGLKRLSPTSKSEILIVSRFYRLRYIARMYITFLSPHTCFGSVCCSIQTTCCASHSSASYII